MDTTPKALGSIIDTPQRQPTADEVYCGLFDYYDHWTKVDPRLSEHHDPLSHVADVFAHDLVNLSVYAQEILYWLGSENIRSAASVVIVGALTEAFITSARSACDELSIALSYAVSEKKKQAPSGSLRALLEWGKKNPHRIVPGVRPVFELEYGWFWKLRSIRDHLVHGGVTPNIFCDGRQFYLWLHHSTRGWITREPLLPMLAGVTQNVIELERHISKSVICRFPLPCDRHGTRMLHGVTIRSLHRLVDIAPDYANPSP